LLLALGYFLFLRGGKSNGLYPVSGTVTWNGAPVAGAIVEFSRQGADPLSQQVIMGLVAEDGSFTLSCGQLGKGAPPGEYDVLIKWPQTSNRPDRFKERYANPNRPRLHAVVKAEPNKLDPFELKNE
jgi:hypothetical protein